MCWNESQYMVVKGALGFTHVVSKLLITLMYMVQFKPPRKRILILKVSWNIDGLDIYKWSYQYIYLADVF